MAPVDKQPTTLRSILVRKARLSESESGVRPASTTPRSLFRWAFPGVSDVTRSRHGTVGHDHDNTPMRGQPAQVVAWYGAGAYLVNGEGTLWSYCVVFRIRTHTCFC